LTNKKRYGRLTKYKEYLLAIQQCNGKCVVCGEQDAAKLHVHHITFKSGGGKTEKENLIVLCNECHEKLHNGNKAIFEKVNKFREEL